MRNCLKLSEPLAGSLSSSGSEFQTVGPAIDGNYVETTARYNELVTGEKGRKGRESMGNRGEGKGGDEGELKGGRRGSDAGPSYYCGRGRRGLKGTEGKGREQEGGKGGRRDLPDRCQTISYAPELGADAMENVYCTSFIVYM